jgi:hypothetical protein
MRRRGSAAIEIGRDGVRGLVLDGPRRQPRLTAWADKRVGDPREIEAAIRAVAEQLDPGTPVRLLLSGSDARIERVDVPKSLRGNLRRAVVDQLFSGDAAEADQYLVGVRAQGTRLGLKRRVAVLLVRREPIETWCALLSMLGHPVTALVSPGSLALTEQGHTAGSVLWVELTGSRTGLTLTRDGDLVEERHLDKPPTPGDEPIAAVEARLQDVRALDQLLRDRGAAGQQVPVDRLVICGAPAIAEPLYHQLREPYEKLGLTLDLVDPWQGVSVGRSPPPPQSAIRLAGCLRLARAAALPLHALPRRVARSRRADRTWAAAAAISLAALLGSTAWMLALEERHGELLAARERTAMALEAARQARAEPASWRETAEGAQWAPLLVDVGHLAKPGVDYRRLVLAREERGARIALAGTANGDGTDTGSGRLLTDLHEEMMRSPFGTGLPGLAASSAGGAEGERRVRFVVEESIAPARRDDPEGSP